MSTAEKRKIPFWWVSTWFGVGFSPKAPGTFGTLAAIPLALLTMWAGAFLHMGITFVLLMVGIFTCDLYEKKLGGHDHQEMVVDEVVGFLITMTWLPMTWQSFVAGFLLFRLLDIWKPFPIRYIDKKVQGGIGVMVDDVAAGVIANILLQYLYTHTNWLGAQMLVVGG